MTFGRDFIKGENSHHAREEKNNAGSELMNQEGELSDI